MGRCGLFIDGGERVPASGSYSIMENPATGEVLGSGCPKGVPEDIDAAVRAAERAFPAHGLVSSRPSAPSTFFGSRRRSQTTKMRSPL